MNNVIIYTSSTLLKGYQMSQKLRLITEYWTNNVKRNEYFINENDNREGKALSYYPSGKLKKVC